MIHSSCVRVHQHSANAKGGSADPCMERSRGGLTTKIHALVDADGRLELTARQVPDASIRPGSLPKQRKYSANIAAKSNRKQTFSVRRWIYLQRNHGERFFNRIR